MHPFYKPRIGSLNNPTFWTLLLDVAGALTSLLGLRFLMPLGIVTPLWLPLRRTMRRKTFGSGKLTLCSLRIWILLKVSLSQASSSRPAQDQIKGMELSQRRLSTLRLSGLRTPSQSHLVSFIPSACTQMSLRLSRNVARRTNTEEGCGTVWLTTWKEGQHFLTSLQDPSGPSHRHNGE